MRIQNLAVIFVIIVLPMTLVLQAYIRNLTGVTNIEARYNEILMSSTYDAVRAYQMNTINNDYSGVNTSRQRDIKASVNSFFNSLATGLHKSGSTKAALNEYVPALLFNLYDGFYVYGPYNNVASVITDNNGDGEPDAEGVPKLDSGDNKVPYFNNNVLNTDNTMYGVKPFTYYSCEYKGTSGTAAYDITINYTLDNYIAVSGSFDSQQISGAGYYINGSKTTVADTVEEFLNNSLDATGAAKTVINSSGVRIKAEPLGEYVSFYDRIKILDDEESPRIIPDMNGAVYARYYRYINYNNTKYYYDDCMNMANTSYSKSETTPPIFTIKNHCREYISLDQLITLANYEGWRSDTSNNTGDIIKRDKDNIIVNEFASKIKDSAWADKYFKDVNPYYYYKKAKGFSEEMNKYLKYIDLTADSDGNIKVIKNNSFNTKYTMTVRSGETVSNDSYIVSNYRNKKVFDYSDPENDPELDASSFNAHRIDVIAKTVESALIKTISSLNDYYGSNAYIYEMPTISMNDWNSIANGITVAAFMQGIPIGNYKFFNNYCIIGNTTNKEFVSKDAIYVQPMYGEISAEQVKKMNNGGVYEFVKEENNVIIDSGFAKKMKYMNFPTNYSTQCLGYNGDATKILTQHNPKCGDILTSISKDENLIAYRKNDYLIESYEHSYEDFRIGPCYFKNTATGVVGGLNERGMLDGYYAYDGGTKKVSWKESVTEGNEFGLWYYNSKGEFSTIAYNHNNTYHADLAKAVNYDAPTGSLYKKCVQQINYYPQCGSNAYECIISHNGYKYTYDQVLGNKADEVGITDTNEKDKFTKLSAAYATCLAREKAAQYKNLDPMNYHRIYMYDHTGSKLLTIATKKSGEAVGVVAFKGKSNDGNIKYWNIQDGSPIAKKLETNYTMPYHDIVVWYNGTDENNAFGK